MPFLSYVPRLEWRYWHKKGYWQCWLPVPEDGFIDLPANARKIELRRAASGEHETPLLPDEVSMHPDANADQEAVMYDIKGWN